MKIRANMMKQCVYDENRSYIDEKKWRDVLTSKKTGCNLRFYSERERENDCLCKVWRERLREEDETTILLITNLCNRLN